MLDLVAERSQQLGRDAHAAHALGVDVDAERVVGRHRYAQAPGVAPHRRRVRLDRPRRPGGVADLVARQHIEHLGRLGHRAREHAVARQERVAEVRPAGDAPARRLEADQAAAGGGDADRAAAVIAVGDRQHAGRDRRGRAAGGAAGRAIGVPRVVRRAGVTRLGRRQDPELGQIRGADDHEAGVAQASHHVRAVTGPVTGQELGAEVHAHARDRDVGLDRDRHAGERPLVTGLDRVGGLERALAVDLDEGVDAVVEVLDPAQRGAHDLTGRDLPTAHQCGELRNRFEHQVGSAHAGGGSLRELGRSRCQLSCE